MEFKSQFKLEFNIKTNYSEMEEVLKIISSNIIDGFKNVNKVTEIEVIPTIVVMKRERASTEEINKRIKDLLDREGVTML